MTTNVPPRIFPSPVLSSGFVTEENVDLFREGIGAQRVVMIQAYVSLGGRPVQTHLCTGEGNPQDSGRTESVGMVQSLH